MKDVADIFRSYTNRGDLSELLLQLGLQDVNSLIKVLQGQDPHSLDTTKVSPDKIFLEYLTSVLPLWEGQLNSMQAFALPQEMKNSLVLLHHQVQLLQTILDGANTGDFFPIVQSMIEAYPKQPPAVKKVIVTILKQVGKPVVLALMYSLYRHGEEAQGNLPEFLQEMGYLAIPALLVALNYTDEKVRRVATEILMKMKAREAVPALVGILKDQSWRVRKSSAEALGEIGSHDAIIGLIQALSDKHASVRLETVRALGKLRDPKILSALVKILDDPSWEVRRAAVEAMAKFGTSASKVLAKALENDSLVARKIAARVLADLGTQEALPALTKALYDKDISVRERAVAALGRIQGEGAIVHLMQALEDKAPLVRFAVIQVLANISNRATLPLLNKALNDPEQVIRQRAKAALEVLVKVEEKEEGKTSPNSQEKQEDGNPGLKENK